MPVRQRVLARAARRRRPRADVIKVAAPGGDPARRWGPFARGRPDPEGSAPFLFFNRNKRGVTLDPASRAGRLVVMACTPRWVPRMLATLVVVLPSRG